MNLSEKIKEVRSNAGLTQTQLATACNLSSSAIKSYEQGNRNPSIEVLENIAKVCGVKVVILLTNN